MADTPKTLLVIDVGVKISAKVVRDLDAAGFIVVRGDPADFHIIGNHPPLTDPMVLKVALETIQNVEGKCLDGNTVRWQFARNLAMELGYAETVRMK